MDRHPPLIGITGRRRKAAELAYTAANFAHFDGEWFYSDYAHAIVEAGGLPVYLPLDVDPTAIGARLDGILLTGGADINPARYGAEPEPELTHVEDDRDESEWRLLEYACEVGMPTLGVCRGLQLINAFHGGTLHQHDAAHFDGSYDVPPESLRHTVAFETGSELERLYGSELAVNSLHHQTVDRLGDSLRGTGWSGPVLEALEHQELPVLAVQWHPEMLPTRADDPLFAWLVDRARG